ncbi:hypothetical protein AVEN_258769-1 [Araneus ventricosus]|uniref:Uncharacterized protein n=1 Tax=Araneus ventricosus TaxID=182803 RepID=A0A4Y2D1F8_ARAVE|nr:hypothetical protein AVEN_258769-1 [Araneus ventricosus]
MSERKLPRKVEQRIVIKFLVGENVLSSEILHTDSNNSMEKSVFHAPVYLSGVSTSERATICKTCGLKTTTPPFRLFGIGYSAYQKLFEKCICMLPERSKK